MVYCMFLLELVKVINIYLYNITNSIELLSMNDIIIVYMNA